MMLPKSCIPLLLVVLCFYWTPIVTGSSFSGLGTLSSYTSIATNPQGYPNQILNTSTFLIAGQPNSYFWNTTTNTQAKSTFSTGSNGAPIGMSLDNDRLFYNTGNTYGGIMCFLDQGKTIYTVSLSTSLATSTTKNVWNLGGTSNAQTCFVDWSRGNLWVFGKTGGYLYKIPLNKDMNQGISPSASTTTAYGLRARASAVNKLTDTAYIACDSAKLIVVPLNTTSLYTNLPVLNVGVSNLMSVGIDEAQNYIFFGTDIGIGLKYSIGKWLEVQLFFIVGSVDLNGVLLHKDRNVSYWYTDDGNVYRVNYDGFNFNVVYDSTNLGSLGDEVYTAFMSPTDNSIAHFVTGSSWTLWKTKLYDCSVHPSCESCSDDPYNCGWCGTTGKCQNKGNCTGPMFTDISQCPTLTSLTPDTGSTLGNTAITVSGTYFPGTGTEKCRFRDGVKTSYVPYSSYVTSGSTITAIRCNTPVYTFNNRTVNVDVVFTSSNISVNTDNVTLPFTYYDCSVATSCGTCNQVGSECGWCMATATCTNRNSCPMSSNSTTMVEFAQNATQCPYISDITPPNGVVQGGTTVIVTGGQFIPTLQYACLFGNSSFANATWVNVTALQCATPVSPTGTIGSVQNVSIVYRNQTSKVYARGGFFIYYNCGTSNSCLVCLTGVCQWCIETASCGAVGSACAKPATVCPVVTGISPDQTFLSNQVNVYVNGTFFNASAYSESFQCKFSNITYATTINATYHDLTSVSCLSPTDFKSQVVQVSMLYKSRVYAPGSQDFEYYSCDTPTCSSCVRSDRPQCGWCAVDNQCKIIGSSNCSTSTMPQTTCPTISSVYPDFGLLDSDTANTTVTFYDALPNGYTFYCNFAGQRTNAYLVSPYSLQCAIPHANVTGVVKLGIDVLNNPYSANVVDFNYLTCQSLNNDCDRCQVLECSWCIPNYCLPLGSASCYAPLSTCPSLDQLNPNHSELTGAEVSVHGSGFSDTFSFSVNVAFGAINNTGPCTYVNESVLDCTFPAFNITAATSAVILGNGVPYLLSNLTYNYHDCESQTTCGDCAAVSSFCGWCLETSSCSQSSGCSGTFLDDCPVVTLENDYASLEGGASIKAESTGLFRSFVPLECVWEGIARVPATFVNNNTITCNSPIVSNTTTVSFTVVYANTSIPFGESPISFDFIDCGYTIDGISEYPCSVCSSITEARCVWCLRDNYCGPDYMCSGESLVNVNECPFISGLNPLSGGKDGGDKLTITGTNFVDDDNLKCYFEAGETVKQSSVNFVSSSSITCKTPKWPGTGQVTMRLALSDVAFSNSFSFTYNKDSSTDETGVIVGSVVGVVVFLGLLGAGVAFLFLKRRGPGALKLVEPNYAAVAFAGSMPAFKLTKTDMEHLESFRQILIHKDLSLALAMLNATKITEADRVAKAICYVFTGASQCVHLLSSTIHDEVIVADRSTQGREILFRSNSMATKIFTQYAKIVGLKYLWDTLARPVAELAALGKEKDTAPDRESSIMRLDSFEVDPTRMELDETDLAINQLQLMLICQKVFTGIMKSVDSIPNEIREVMRTIKNQVGKIYPDSTYIGMGGFFFLRFICPAMTAPHVYGLLPNPPNEETQRYLVLLSKALQNLANNTLPGVKETYMQKMNEFITSNQSKLINFFDQMVADDGTSNANNNNNNNSSNSTAKSNAPPVPKTQEDSALAYLYSHTFKESKNVYTNLNETNSKDVVSALTSLFAEGPPPEQIK